MIRSLSIIIPFYNEEKRIQKEYQSEKHITTNKKRSYGYNNKHKYDLTIKKLKTLKPKRT